MTHLVSQDSQKHVGHGCRRISECLFLHAAPKRKDLVLLEPSLVYIQTSGSVCLNLKAPRGALSEKSFMMSSRRSVETNFISTLSRTNGSMMRFSPKRCRKFASRARAYICTYHHLATRNDAGGEMEGVSFKEIQAICKAFRTHRCAMDFDTKIVTI